MNEIISSVVAIIKLLIVLGLPLGGYLWWKNGDTRRREQEKQAQERFNLILTQEKQRQKRQQSGRPLSG